MINIIKLFVSSLFILTLVSCTKDDQCAKSLGIYGEWIWIESVGGIGGLTITPETENKTIKLSINDFYFRQFVNDSLILDTEYELEVSKKPGEEDMTFIKYESGGIQLIKIEEKELELTDYFHDGFTHTYRRN